MITIEVCVEAEFKALGQQRRTKHPGDEPDMRLARTTVLGVVGLLRAKGPEHAGSVDALLAVIETLRPPPARRWTWRVLDVDGSLVEVAVYR